MFVAGSHPQTAAVLSEEDELDRRVAATWSHMKGNITTQPVAVVDHKVGVVRLFLVLDFPATWDLFLSCR